MRVSRNKGIPAWLWGALIVILGALVGLLVIGDRREDPREAYRFDTTKYQRVDPEHVLFEEVGKIVPPLEHVSALAVGPDGHIYVAGGQAIVVFDLDGEEINRFSLSRAPDCMAVGPDGAILLGMRDHVEELSAEGTPKPAWDKLGDKAYISSIAAGEDEVYVADAGRRVVLRFDRKGTLLGRIGEADEEREIPGFVVPSPYFDVALDAHSGLWAVNPGRLGIENYRPNGDLVTAWYRPSMRPDGFCGCCNPTHIAFRSDGGLVTTEKGISRVKLYSPDQVFMGLVAGPNAFGESAGEPFSDELESPLRDLAVDTRDRVLVLDKQQGAVRIFEKRKRNQNSKSKTDN